MLGVSQDQLYKRNKSVRIVAVLDCCGRALLKLSGTAGNLQRSVNRANPLLINLPQISANFKDEKFKICGPLFVENFIRSK
jgi:hypothetical protein